MEMIYADDFDPGMKVVALNTGEVIATNEYEVLSVDLPYITLNSTSFPGMTFRVDTRKTKFTRSNPGYNHNLVLA